RQDPLGEAGVISIFLENIKQNRPLSVYGDGTTSRDYLNVTDLAELITFFADKKILGCYNISTGKETTLNDLIETILRVTGADPVINNLPLRHGEVRNICLSNQKVRDITGWKPKVELEEGISSVWKWINSL
ncbi:MAG: GDP-mannose 4,6-dehydratase, partial [Candidatus Hodarchaeales archaeon]